MGLRLLNRKSWSVQEHPVGVTIMTIRRVVIKTTNSFIRVFILPVRVKQLVSQRIDPCDILH